MVNMVRPVYSRLLLRALSNFCHSAVLQIKANYNNDNHLPIWEERSPQPQAIRGKELFCSAESFGAGATLQRCHVT